MNDIEEVYKYGAILVEKLAELEYDLNVYKCKNKKSMYIKIGKGNLGYTIKISTKKDKFGLTGLRFRPGINLIINRKKKIPYEKTNVYEIEYYYNLIGLEMLVNDLKKELRYSYIKEISLNGFWLKSDLYIVKDKCISKVLNR